MPDNKQQKKKTPAVVFGKCMVPYCMRMQTKVAASLGLPKMCSMHADWMNFLVWVMGHEAFKKQWPSGLIKPL